MRFFVLIACVLLSVAGCKKTKPATASGTIPSQFQVEKANTKVNKTAASKKQGPDSKKTNPPRPLLNQPIITPDDTPYGTVILVNGNARFAVVNFSYGPVPPAGRIIFAYRDGLKVAQLKVTGPQREDNTIADIVSGEVRLKDEIKME